VLHKQPDHSVDVDVARKAIAEILGTKEPAPPAR